MTAVGDGADKLLRDQLVHLRRELINDAKTPNERALLLVALELAELRNTIESAFSQPALRVASMNAERIE